jgi:hypothetical protein
MDIHWIVCWGVLVQSGRMKKHNEPKLPPTYHEGYYACEMLNTPQRIFLQSSLHMFFGPAWLCIEPCSSVLHVLLFSKRTCQIYFVLLEILFFLLPPSRFEMQTFQLCKIKLTVANIQALEDVWFLFYSNNFHSQKVKPFSAGLHCQAQKGRRTELDGGYNAL